MPKIAFALALGSLAGLVVIFVMVQVLQSYPFHNGVYGNQSLFLGVTYTEGLELFGVTLATSLFGRAYMRSEGSRKDRIFFAVGTTLLLLGVPTALVVYAETNLLWGNVLPGVRLWQGLQGGGGFPWGGEQVAYNTCLIPSSVRGDCAFLNYDELFWLALVCSIVGLVLRNTSRNQSALA